MIHSDRLLALDASDQAAVEHVRHQLRRIKRLGVAFSGGVDSAVLLALATVERGNENVVALLGVSPSLARREHALATDIARCDAPRSGDART